MNVGNAGSNALHVGVGQSHDIGPLQSMKFEAPPALANPKFGDASAVTITSRTDPNGFLTSTPTYTDVKVDNLNDTVSFTDLGGNKHQIDVKEKDGKVVDAEGNALENRTLEDKSVLTVTKTDKGFDVRIDSQGGIWKTISTVSANDDGSLSVNTKDNGAISKDHIRNTTYEADAQAVNHDDLSAGAKLKGSIDEVFALNWDRALDKLPALKDFNPF